MIPKNSPPKPFMKPKPITVPKLYASPSSCSLKDALPENDHKKSKKPEKSHLDDSTLHCSTAMIPNNSPPNSMASSSLKDALPESPSPIYSSDESPSSLASNPRSPIPDKFHFAGEDSRSPEKQSSCTPWNNENDSRVEADEYTHNAFRSDILALSNMQHNYPRGAEMDSSSLQDNRGQPIVSQSTSGSLSELMTRLKHYSAFLNDVKKQEFEAEIEAWERAQEEEASLDRSTRKEDDITEPESRHPSKTTEEMQKVEENMALDGSGPQKGSAAGTVSSGEAETMSFELHGTASMGVNNWPNVAEDSMGFKISPNTVFIMSFGLIAFVVLLHLTDKLLKE